MEDGAMSEETGFAKSVARAARNTVSATLNVPFSVLGGLFDFSSVDVSLDDEDDLIAAENLVSPEIVSKDVDLRSVALQDIESVAKLLFSPSCNKIVFLTGAGISVAAGIPDFRSFNKGIYNTMLAEYELSNPSLAFQIDYFERDPHPFFKVVNKLSKIRAQPTNVHMFISFLEQKGMLQRCYTQNVDDLQLRSGVSDEKVVYSHGVFFTSTCTNKKCLYQMKTEDALGEAESDNIAICPECGDVIRPDVTLFGEKLPDNFFKLAEDDFTDIDLMVIIGTSLVVDPFASLVSNCRKKIPKIFITNDVGIILSKMDVSKDVVLEGDCQEIVLEILRKVGWLDEFTSYKEAILDC